MEKYDVLVIGSGISGLYFSLKIAEKGHLVAIVTKKAANEASTNYAQGGIAAVLSPEDSFEKHIQDTIRVGCGLCDPNVVHNIVKAGPECLKNLMDYGAQFTINENTGDLDLGLEGGHSARRVAHAKDLTGQEIERSLLDQTRKNDHITIYPHHIAVNLFIHTNGGCIGAYVLDTQNGIVKNFATQTTLLATGGASKTFLYTSNPDIATGDGIAMAYRAGAKIMNMELTQFHPTILYHPREKSFLISEALRGEGAVLHDAEGNQFMEKYHPDKELAPRDIVSRAIDHELKTKGDEYVFLNIADYRDTDFIKNRFPGIYEKCLNLGVDITKEAIPVVPAAHYFIGGIKTSVDGQTNVKNLFAIGEVACTGFHGANRLASNSLLEASVMAHYAAESVHKQLKRGKKIKTFPEWQPGDAVDSDEAVVVNHNWDEVRRLMWNYVGIVRSNKRLERATNRIKLLLEEINEYYWNFTITPDLVELRNIARVADLIIEGAQKRKESRGVHYSVDYPEKSPKAENTILARPQSILYRVC
ncbi:MAG: L-aspartate oxidase [Candidatus Hermodarchaeota archaeon]